MTTNYIKMCVAHYFRFARQCPIVAMEYWHYQDSGVQPDVLVLDAAHRPIEIEVKTSLSDFKADARKHIWNFRKQGMKWPWKFYYALPTDLEEQVKPLLRKGVGLLRVSQHNYYKPEDAVSVAVTAPKHEDFERITGARLKRIIAGQSSSLCRALKALDSPPGNNN